MELLEDPKAEVVDEIAAKLGLRKVLRLFLSLREDLGSVLETSRWLAWPGLVWDCSRSDAGPARFEASLVFIRRLKKDASVGTVTCNPPDILLVDCLKVGQKRNSRSKTPAPAAGDLTLGSVSHLPAKADPSACEVSLHVSGCTDHFLSPALGDSSGSSSVLIEPPVCN